MLKSPNSLLIASVLALFAAGLGAAGQFAKLSVPFEALQSAYPEAGASLGFVVSIISFLGVLFGLFAGILVARLGFRRLLLGALVLGAGLSALQALMLPLPILLISRLLEGASHLVIVVAAPTLMANISPPAYRPRVMTLWSTFFGASFALVAFLGLPLVEAAGLWALIAAHSVWMAAVAVALMILLPKIPVAEQTSLTIKDVLRRHATAYKSARINAPALGWLCYTITYVALLTVLPSQLAEADQHWAALVLPLAGLVVSMTIGMALLRVMDGVTLAVSGFALAAVVTLVLMAQPQNAWLAVGLLAVLGLVQGGSFAAVPQLNSEADGQALANGAMAQMGNLGNTVGTPLLLVLLSFGGVPAIFVGLTLCYVAGASLHIWQAARRRSEGYTSV